MKKSKQLQMLPTHKLELGVKLLMHDDSIFDNDSHDLLAGQISINNDSIKIFKDMMFIKVRDIKITSPEFSKLLGDAGLYSDDSESTFVWEMRDGNKDETYLYFWWIKRHYYLDAPSYYPAYTPEELKLTLLKRLNLNKTITKEVA